MNTCRIPVVAALLVLGFASPAPAAEEWGKFMRDRRAGK
jgi:hypothetical protein